MPYCLERQRPIGEELRRHYTQQLTAAIACLTGARAQRDGIVHACRKHVKKARAVLDIVAREIAVHDARRELNTANRALGRLADAHHVICVTASLKGYDGGHRLDAALRRLHHALVARSAALERLADVNATRLRVARLLESARLRAAPWDTTRLTRATVVRAIGDAHRRARRARRAAFHYPTVGTYHDWRRRNKVDWYLVRLVAEHTRQRMIDHQHRLAALDSCLGQLHDADVLASMIVSEPLLPRPDSARVLAALRRLARDLRRRARPLSVVLDDRPREVINRVKVLWLNNEVRGVAEEAPCRRAA